MRLPFENEMRQPKVIKIIHITFYTLLALSLLMFYLFYREREKNSEIQEKFQRYYSLDSEVSTLVSNEISMEEVARFAELAKEGIFKNWFDVATWLETLRREAKKRDIQFRYSMQDTPKVEGQLYELTLTFALSSPFEGYARYISFMSSITSNKEYQITLDGVKMSRGETGGIKETNLIIKCWVAK